MITLKNVSKNFGEKQVFNNLNLNIKDNIITAILGESGSGKTTLLNILAGLTDYTGEITGLKKTSYIFQGDRLIRCLTVKENLELINPKMNVVQALDSVGLTDKINNYPASLSGGQARRINIIRGLYYPSEVLLMDEPFNSLDLKLKIQLMDTVKINKKENNRSVIFVTHDIDEALYLADEILILKNGSIAERFDDISDKKRSEIKNVLLND